jgi:hypothetical protein
MVKRVSEIPLPTLVEPAKILEKEVDRNMTNTSVSKVKIDEKKAAVRRESKKSTDPEKVDESKKKSDDKQNG